MIFLIGLEVAFQMLNPAAQDRNLYISRTGILLMCTEFRNRLSFTFLSISFAAAEIEQAPNLGKRYSGKKRPKTQKPLTEAPFWRDNAPLTAARVAQW